LARQADIHRATVETCLAAPTCTRVTVWDYTDRYSWIPEEFPGFGAAHLLDGDYLPKPAYGAVAGALGAPALPR